MQQSNATPEEQAVYEQVVLSGMKVLYDEATHGTVMEMLSKGADDPAQTLSNIVTLVITEVDDRNNGAIPETVILPAAMELMDAVTELAEVAGLFEVTPDIAETATHMLLAKMGDHYGIDQASIEQFMASIPPDQIAAAGEEASRAVYGWNPAGPAPAAAKQPAPADEKEAA
jgi:hypothetical protein